MGGAKGQKQHAAQKGGPQKGMPQKGPGKPPAQQPASKSTQQPTPKEKPSCPRCYRHMVPGDDTNHKVSKCSKRDVYREDDKFMKLWPQYADAGDKEKDKVEDYTHAQKLMDAASNRQAEYNSKPLTKRLLEHAFQVAYEGLRTTASQKSPNKPTATGLTTKVIPSRPAQGNEIPFNAITGPSHAQQTAVQFCIDQIPHVTPKENEPRYDLAVHQKPDLDTSLVSKQPPPQRSFKGEDVFVAANFVVVNKVPPKLYTYSIAFGGTERVKTVKEQAEDKNAADAKDANAQSAQSKEFSGRGSNSTDGGKGEEEQEEDGDAVDATDAGGTRKVAQRSEKARIFKALATHDEFQGAQWATDYTLLWTLQPLKLTNGSDCTITNIEYSKLSGRKHKLDTITFFYVRTIDVGSSSAEATKLLLDTVAHPDPNASLHKGAGMRITALNAFVSKSVVESSDVISVGPNKFFVKDDWSPAGNMLNIRRGYFTSIRPGSDSVLLNVNVATSAFYNSIRVSEVFRMCANDREAMASLKGLTVFIRYRREEHDHEYNPNLEQQRHRVIAGFGNRPEDETFRLETGERISVFEYFQRLGYTIRQTKLPVISVNIAPRKRRDDQSEGHEDEKAKGENKSKEKGKNDYSTPKIHWIPPELLSINPYQPYGKLLPPHLTETMIEKALRHPAKTQNMIMSEGFRLLGLKTQPSIFQPLQLGVEGRLIQVPGVLMKAPSVVYWSNKEQAVHNAAWNVKWTKFFSPPPNNGVIPYPLHGPIGTIDYRPLIRHDSIANAGQQVGRHMDQKHGIKFRNGVQNKHVLLNLSGDILDYPSEEQDEEIVARDVLKNFIKKHGDISMVIVLLPKKQAETYGLIKRVCDQHLGLHTVCLVEEKLLIMNPKGPAVPKPFELSHQSNLALKFNMKLRGHNHRVGNPGTTDSFFKGIAEDTIVFGADVSHAGSSMPFTPSVAAVVASDDREFAHFPGSVRLQASTQEIIADLEDMVYYRLLRFWTYRRCMPTRILFYRDGVSEDQFEMCRQDEIPAIRRAYERVMKDRGSANATGKGKGRARDDSAQMKLTFIVVGKRHHTRFFATTPNQTWPDNGGLPASCATVSADNPKLNGNVKAGLLVDQVITRPAVDHTKDFFLQSHAALKGTARSAHYSVLEMNGFTLDAIKTLTHAFCYNYQRATRGVSYAGPAYYADRLAERGTVYLKGFTKDRSKPPFEMTKDQKARKKEGAKEFAKQIADHISKQEVWNPRQDQVGREPNPWVPKFDNCMFWL